MVYGSLIEKVLTLSKVCNMLLTFVLKLPLTVVCNEYSLSWPQNVPVTVFSRNISSVFLVQSLPHELYNTTCPFIQSNRAYVALLSTLALDNTPRVQHATKLTILGSLHEKVKECSS
ncbi:hypothetical protein RB195_009983 [Necator americanus]|uniref:Uncharacterized protein n=1 Tax=Necator americanus TaxID=51031 RepID=A0ABR1CVS9_NECAM